MAQDDTYQTKVYHERGGGNTEVVKSDGILRGHSGGIMSAESGFIFALADQEILAKDVTRVVHSWNDTVVITPAFNSVKLTGQNELPRNVRMVTIIGSVTMSKASYWLTSCSAGAEVYLRLVGDLTGTFTNANTSMAVYLSADVTLLGSGGSALTSMLMQTSAATDAMVHLVAHADNCWAIIGQYGNVVEY